MPKNKSKETHVQGILLKITPNQLPNIEKSRAAKNLTADVIGQIKKLRQATADEVAVVGVNPAGENRLVVLTAQIDSVLVGGQGVRLKYVKTFAQKARWNLPRGYAQSYFFEKNGFEILPSETDVLSCFVKSPIELLTANGPKVPAGFKWNSAAAINLVITFDALSGSQLHGRAAFDQEVLGRFQSYAQVLDQVWAQMSGGAFEEAMGDVFELLGFKVERTGRSGDGGVDLILLREDAILGTDRYVVQCKRYRADRTISSDVVRQIQGTAAVEKAQRAIVVTTSSFTTDAIEAATKGVTPVQLVDAKALATVVLPRIEALPSIKKLLGT